MATTSTAIPRPTVASADITDGSIVNADVASNAAIAGSKVSPDFGNQNIVTTGTCATGALSCTTLTPSGATSLPSGPVFTVGATSPGFTMTARSTDAATTDMVFAPQAPWASATSTNRNSASCHFNIAAAAAGGTQGSFVIDFAGTDRFTVTESSGVTQINVPGSGSLLRASSTKLAWDANGVQVYGTFTASGNVGFYGGSATAKQTVTGSRGGNAALASLLTALAAIGLLTDSSSA